MTKKYLRHALIHTWLVCAVACSAPTSEELLASARQAIAAGAVRTAEIHIKNLLQQQPDHAEARQLLAEVSLIQGAGAAAEDNLRRALRLGASPEALQLPLLRALLIQGKFEDVLEQIEAGPAVAGSDRVSVLSVAGAAHRGLGSLPQAEAAYRAALAIEPDLPELRVELAAVLFQMGRTDEATQLIAALLEERPDFAPALLVRGNIELRTGRYEAAQASFEEVLRLEDDRQQTPGYLMALAQLIETQLAQRKVEEAAENAEALVSIAPEDPIARFLMARVEVEQADEDAAERRLEGVVADFPEYWPAHALLGSINLKQAQLGQAEMYLRTAVNNNPSDNSSRLLLAEMLIRRGDIAAAKELVTAAAPAGFTDGLLLALAGRTSLQAGQPDLAAEYFRQSERNPPENLQELVGTLGVYMATGEFERAVRLIEAASFDRSEDQRLADYLLALVQLRQGDLESAARTAGRLAEQFSDAAWPLNLRGTIALLAGDLQAAEEFLSRALDMDPTYIPALLGAARVAGVRGDREAAAAHLRRVLELDSQQVAATVGLAQLAAQGGDFEAARTWLARVPPSAARSQLEGEIAVAEGRFDEAATAFSRAYSLQPSAELALRSYAAASRAGRPRPETELQAWSEARPGDPRIDFALGSLALSRGDHAAAMQRYEAVLAADPNHADTLNNLAWIYSERGDDRAVELAGRAYELRPGNAAIADTLGWLHVRGGDAAKGLPLLEQALEQAPDHPEIRYHWAVALAETGESERALGAFQALLATGADFPGRSDAQERLAELQGNRQ